MRRPVLLVHQNAEARAGVGAALRAAGVEVVEAAPETAGTAVSLDRPGVVLTTVPVPRADRVPVVIGWGCDPGDEPDDVVPPGAPPDEVARRVLVHVRHLGARLRERARAARRTAPLAEAQKGVLPRPGSVPGIRFGAAYVPALEAGGDFYDVVRLGHGAFGMLVADAMGHDLGAAYATGALKAGLRLAVELESRPAGVLRVLNRALRAVLAEGSYVTAAYVRVDRYRRRITVAAAGHPPAVVVRAGGGVEIVELEGDVLGVHPTVVIPERCLPVDPGSRVYLYTDGLLDAFRPGVAGRAGALEVLTGALGQVGRYPVELAVAEVAARAAAARVPPDDVVLLGAEV